MSYGEYELLAIVTRAGEKHGRKAKVFIFELQQNIEAEVAAGPVEHVAEGDLCILEIYDAKGVMKGEIFKVLSN